MIPITIEFNVSKNGKTFTEDSVTLNDADEFFRYVAPGGGCEHMPANLGEIQMIFVSTNNADAIHKLADKRVNLQIGMVILSGPLSTILQVSDQLIEKQARGEISSAFATVTGLQNIQN